MPTAADTKRIQSFKVINQVIAPFSSAGRSSALTVEDKFKMEAWSSPEGIYYKFLGKQTVLTPWSNVIEVVFAAD